MIVSVRNLHCLTGAMLNGAIVTPLKTAALVITAVTVLLGHSGTPASAQSRIKDIVNVEGVRDNLLVGYGLVVGLNGTGSDCSARA